MKMLKTRLKVTYCGYSRAKKRIYYEFDAFRFDARDRDFV